MTILEFMSRSPILTGFIVLIVAEVLVRVVYVICSRKATSMYCPRCGHTLQAATRPAASYDTDLGDDIEED
jgi:hypothetical protein